MGVKRAKKTGRERLMRVLWWVALACFVGSALALCVYYLGAHKEEEKMRTLAHAVSEAEAKAPQDAADPLLERYAALAAENPDFVGWLRLPDTQLDYPVMHTPAAPEYYLRRAFDKTYALSGTPFLDAACSLGAQGANRIIYGHNMKSGAMFAALEGYLKQAYWQAHPVLRFDTLTERGTYEVFAVVRADTAATNPDALAAYQTLLGASEAQYDAYITYLKENSLYDTGITPVYGDTLVSLSTCDNVEEAGRIVVAARKTAG